MQSKKSPHSQSNDWPGLRANLLLLFALTGGLLTGAARADTPSAPPVFTSKPLPHHIYDGGWEHYVGGGVASFDCNGDALPELYAAGGTNPAQLMLNRSAPAVTCGSKLRRKVRIP